MSLIFRVYQSPMLDQTVNLKKRYDQQDEIDTFLNDNL
jgi:hypothetical protein